jgi:sugar (pentulose or hexulose) kinase
MEGTVRNVCLGLDIGSTFVKAVAIDSTTGEPLGEARRATPWMSVSGGGAQFDAPVLADLVDRLVDEMRAAVPGEVMSIGVSGMAEAGVLLDAAGRPQAPVLAWFDPRGASEIAETPGWFQEAFPGRTGLPVGPLATVAKLCHLAGEGHRLLGHTWLSLPEYVVRLLGGELGAEPSLVARTGLIDQDTGAPWGEALDLLGVDTSFLPPIRTAGSVWGHHTATGAVLTVAGHDHLVASVSAGVVDSGDLYDSIGTAEALVRPLRDPLGGEARAALAGQGINVVRHLLPDHSVMLAGAKTGLLLRRVLQLVGVNDSAGRDMLDKHVVALGEKATTGLTVGGARNDEGVLTLSVDADGVSPEALFAAALKHCTAEVRRLLDIMAPWVDSPTRSVVSGGWSQMASVRAARCSVLPNATFSPHPEDTAVGAALLGACAAENHPDVVAFMRGAHTRTLKN